MKIRKLKKGCPYIIKYYDHFEHDDIKSLTIEELGFYIDEDDRYYYFYGHRDSTGKVYNRTGIIKEQIVMVRKLRV